MIRYAIWNNKGGVGKTYLTFQVACEYARQHPERRVLVVDVCPQANVSGVLLGGIGPGDEVLERLALASPLLTISGYVEERIVSPYVNPRSGNKYALQVSTQNEHVPENLWLIPGDEQLEIQSDRVVGATRPGPADAWRIVHLWLNDLIQDITNSESDWTVFFDCNPSFSIYTEMALCAADRLIVPFTADGSSRRSVRSVLSLVYGVQRTPGSRQSTYFSETARLRMASPKIYCFVGNRLTQHKGAANAFGKVVSSIGQEIESVWKTSPGSFLVHPRGTPIPRNGADFRRMFQAEIRDANTASVVSTVQGKPLFKLKAGMTNLMGKQVMVNQKQLDDRQPDLEAFVQSIE